MQCDVFYNPDREKLAKAWQQLEARSRPNFFLSWLWIGTWLECCVDDCYLVEARTGKEVVGLGILVAKKSRLPFDSRQSYFLHQTGDPEQDQLCIEYNDFLLLPAYAEKARTTMLSKIFLSLVGNGALVIGACQKGLFNSALRLGAESRCVWDSVAYKLDLNRLRADDMSLEQSLSRSGRYQIKRSLKRYERQGKITITTATTTDEALAMFADAEPFHIARWGALPGQSGFTNPKFKHFHHTLIRRGAESGEVVLHTLCAGDEPIGVIYNFHYDNQVYFYLSALNYNLQDKHLKPGLTAHYLLINQALSKGMEGYDFMAGVTRYKQTFANSESPVATYHYQQPHLALKVEDSLRRFKRRITSGNSPSPL
ncbi:GNAT family N-acetyltransferase [Photobacterium proteolyticum]|uniref:GNAT family N-acetyltransferase n=1 Tax=Photobacterium proteolyticum TaxID=1903952 RepID=UPI00158818C8|nr:GNAT family N-acetyltransferase [Photobacterium proteolyticum]